MFSRISQFGKNISTDADSKDSPLSKLHTGTGEQIGAGGDNEISQSPASGEPETPTRKSFFFPRHQPSQSLQPQRSSSGPASYTFGSLKGNSGHANQHSLDPEIIAKKNNAPKEGSTFDVDDNNIDNQDNIKVDRKDDPPKSEDGVTLSGSKFRKFLKYEEKYPGRSFNFLLLKFVINVISSELLKAYHLEKEKSEQVLAFERVLAECTPCHSIAEPDALSEYLENINLKSSMMNEELRRMAQEATKLKAQHASEMAHLKKNASIVVEDDLTILKIEKQSLLEKVQDMEIQLNTNATASLDQITEIQVQKSALSLDLETAKAAQSDLQLKFDELQTISKSDQLNIKLLEQKLAVCANDEGQLQTAKLENIQLNAQISELKDYIKGQDLKMTAAYADNKDHLRSTKQEIGQIRALVSEYKDNVRDMGQKINTYASYADQLQEAKLENTALNTHVTELKDSIQVLEQLVTQLKTEKTTSEKELEILEIPVLTAVVPSPETLVPLSKSQKKKKRKKAAASAALLNNRDENLTLIGDVDKEALNGSIKSSQAVISMTFEELKSDYKLKITESQQSLEAEKVNHKEIISKLTTKHAEELDIFKSTNKKLEADVIILRSSIDEITQRADESMRSLKSTQAKLALTFSSLAKAESDLMAEREKLSNIERSTSETIDQLGTALTTAEKELQTKSALLEEKIDQLKTALTMKEKELLVKSVLLEERNDKITSLEDSIASLRINVDSLNEKASISDSLKENLDRRTSELQRLCNVENNLRGEISSLSLIASEKDDIVTDLRSKIGIMTETQRSTEDRMTGLHQKLQNLEGEVRVFQEREARGKQSFEGLRRELDVQRNARKDRENEILQLRNEIKEHRDRLEHQESQNAISESLLQANRKETEAISEQLMKVTGRCESLEQELTDTHKHLQERLREASNMRRLLTNTEGSQQSKLQEAMDKLEVLTEQRDLLESESTQLAKRRTREADGFIARIRELEQTLTLVEKEKMTYHRDAEELRSSRAHADDKLQAAELESEDLQQVVTQLKDTLAHTEASLRTVSKTNTKLNLMVEESKTRLDKMNRTQHSLKSSIHLLQTDKSKLKQQLENPVSPPLSSKRSSASFSSVKSAPSMPLKPQSVPPPANIPYIKNVLLGFLEHKTQRQQLLPVVSTILDFTSADEKRFWNALG